MSIPNTIDHSHLIKAIQRIKVNGVPKRRASTKYDLLYEGSAYPPKYVVSLANTFVNERELRHFSGGRETTPSLPGISGHPQQADRAKIGIEAEDEDDAEVYAEGRFLALHRKLERNLRSQRKLKQQAQRKGRLCRCSGSVS
jgi:hypothetical protein